MGWLLLVIVVIGALVAWIYYYDSEPDIVSKEKVSGTYSNLKDKVTATLPARGKSTQQQFTRWLDTAAPAERDQLYKNMPQAVEALKVWSAQLSADEAEKFSRDVTHFCEMTGFDLAWLSDSKIDESLKQSVEDAVLLHALGYWKAAVAATEIKAFAAYQAWQTNPSSKENKAFSQKLFAKLNETGQVSASPPELFLATEEKREAHIIQAIQEAAEKDKLSFNRTLKEIQVS